MAFIPYVGVTGFMDSLEVEAVADYIPESSSYRLMVGVLASSKTLAGKSNRWPGRFPKIGAIASIFMGDPRTFNLIHYSTDDPGSLAEQLEELEGFGGPYFHGFQLNVCWPDPELLEDYRRRTTRLRPYLVLQIGSGAIGAVGSDPGRLVRRVLEYGSLIDAVLIDPSGGYGRELHLTPVRNYLRVISAQSPELGLGVAGGFSDESLSELLGDLPALFAGLSIDAEGRLRTPKVEDPSDPDFPGDRLFIEHARNYIWRAIELLEPTAPLSREEVDGALRRAKERKRRFDWD